MSGFLAPDSCSSLAEGLSRSPRQSHERPANVRSLSLQIAAKSACSSKRRPLHLGRRLCRWSALAGQPAPQPKYSTTLPAPSPAPFQPLKMPRSWPCHVDRGLGRPAWGQKVWGSSGSLLGSIGPIAARAAAQYRNTRGWARATPGSALSSFSYHMGGGDLIHAQWAEGIGAFVAVALGKFPITRIGARTFDKRAAKPQECDETAVHCCRNLRNNVKDQRHHRHTVVHQPAQQDSTSLKECATVYVSQRQATAGGCITQNHATQGDRPASKLDRTTMVGHQASNQCNTAHYNTTYTTSRLWGQSGMAMCKHSK
jgi:hypothetical protein